MGKLVEEIKKIESEWDASYKEYLAAARSADEQVEHISQQLNLEIGTINTLKEIIEPKFRILYNFLSGLGNVAVMPDYTRLIKEEPCGYLPAAYLSTLYRPDYSNEKEIGKLKDIGRTLKNNFLYGASGRYSRPKLKEAIMLATQNYKKEQIDWKNDISKRIDQKNDYELKLKIAKIYHEVFSVVIRSIDETILPELPGINAFLYAQGVKDAICSGRLPSEAKPVPIKRYMNSKVYSRHVNFIQNAHDFYTLFRHYYENNYLTEIFANKDERTPCADIERINKKVETMKNNAVFGVKHG